MEIPKGLLPTTEIIAEQLVDGKTGDVTPIKYLVGHPRSYRFNASNGFFNVNGIQPISQVGQAITIIPIAYRVFNADILGVKGKRWVEFFFLNQDNQLCNLLLHGYSVESLMDATKEIFYENVNLCGIALTIQPQEKTSKKQDENGKYPKYYICSFTYKVLGEIARENLQAAVADFAIYRADTITEQVEVQVAVNYNPPKASEGLTEAAATAEAKAAEAREKKEEQVSKEAKAAATEAATVAEQGATVIEFFFCISIGRRTA